MNSVYRYYDDENRLLYIGVTNRGIARASEHATTKHWWSLVRRCEIEHHESRKAALDRERFLIESLNPAFNVVHNGPTLGRLAAVSSATPDELRGALGPVNLKARRLAFYAMPPEEQRKAPCVVCGAVGWRRRCGRPSCPSCESSMVTA